MAMEGEEEGQAVNPIHLREEHLDILEVELLLMQLPIVAEVVEGPRPVVLPLL